MAFCPLQVSKEEMEVRPAYDPSVYPDSVFKGSHGLNFANLLCNPVLKENTAPPPAAYTKQRLVKSINFYMCTETLGCETGAMCSSYELEIDAVKNKKKNSPSLSMMEETKQRSIPPPLTTLSGEGRLSLGIKRKEGRLMLFPFKPSVLEAERSGGRLRLLFFPRGDVIKADEEEDGADKEEERAEETRCFVYGGGEKYMKAGRCKEEEAFFNRDACWVASS